MSLIHEKAKFQLLPALAALVISVALTGLGAYGFAKATGGDGSAVTSYQPKGIITIEWPKD